MLQPIDPDLLLTSNGTSQTASSGIPKSANTDMEEDVSAIEEVPIFSDGSANGWMLDSLFCWGFCLFFCFF